MIPQARKSVYVCVSLLLIHLTSADILNDPTNVSYNIRNTDQYQPSLLLTVEDGIDLEVKSGKGYVVGYKGCGSNPTKVCYINDTTGVSCYIRSS